MNAYSNRKAATARLSRAADEDAQKTIVRRLVMRRAEGNVSLHRGRYFTQTDVDEIVTRALSRDFSVYTNKK